METKHHHIRYAEAPPSGGPAEWEAEIGKVNGVAKVEIDPGKKDVFVEYDLVKCCEEAVEHYMAKMGFTLDSGFMQRLKRGWIHYTEENERDALQSKGHPCCDVEELERKKKELEKS